MTMPSANTITNGTAFFLTFISMVIAGLSTFDWLTFFTPEQALQIVGGLNLLGLLVKSWMASAELMAKNMAAK